MKTAVKYSPTERRLLGIMRKRRTRPINTVQLSDIYYTGIERPWHGRGLVGSAMRELMKKVEFNKEPFRIVKSPRRGPHPVEFKLIEK